MTLWLFTSHGAHLATPPRGGQQGALLKGSLGRRLLPGAPLPRALSPGPQQPVGAGRCESRAPLPRWLPAREDVWAVRRRCSGADWRTRLRAGGGGWVLVPLILWRPVAGEPGCHVRPNSMRTLTPDPDGNSSCAPHHLHSRWTVSTAVLSRLLRSHVEPASFVLPLHVFELVRIPRSLPDWCELSCSSVVVEPCPGPRRLHVAYRLHLLSNSPALAEVVSGAAAQERHCPIRHLTPSPLHRYPEMNVAGAGSLAAAPSLNVAPGQQLGDMCGGG